MVPETLVDTINVFAGESSDQDQGVLSLEDKSIQEATGKLPNPPECNAEVHLFPYKSFRVEKDFLSLNASLQVQVLFSFFAKREQRGCQGGEEYQT